jgi:D-tyrosyl-tRNA(Tyr) deacylase
MRVVLQRVSRGQVSVGAEIIGQIGAGLLLLVGFTDGDDASTLAWMADKVVDLRIFADPEGKMNLSLADVGGALLVVSQFTLYGDVRRGRRPSFVEAASPDRARVLYQDFVQDLQERGFAVQTGEFGAMMQVELTNDGPVTLILER